MVNIKVPDQSNNDQHESEDSSDSSVHKINVSHNSIVVQSGLADSPGSSESITSDKTEQPSIQATKHELNIAPSDDFKPPKATEPSPKEVIRPTDEPAKTPVQNSDSESPLPTKKPSADKSETQLSDSDKSGKINEADEQRKQELQIRQYQEQIEALVLSKRFFLPIKSQEKRNNRLVLIGVVICILLAIAWVDVALDSGLINNNYHLPHTHFFSLKS